MTVAVTATATATATASATATATMAHSSAFEQQSFLWLTNTKAY